MEIIRCYQDLEVWQKSMDLVVHCYELTQTFPKTEQYGLCSQMQRAAVSIPANIAEGRERNHTKEFIRFLSIAKGSLAEFETLTLLTQRLNYISEDNSKIILLKAAEVGRMITGLQRTLSKKL